MRKHFPSKKSDQHTAVTVVADFIVDFSRTDKWLIQFILRQEVAHSLFSLSENLNSQHGTRSLH